MEETFKVRFQNSEEHYIHSEGVNTGYTRSFNKVDRCLFLSDRVRKLYLTIRSYAYGEKRDCHPSQATLRVDLRWSKQTLKTYMDELEASGAIFIERKAANKTSTYWFMEIQNVHCVVHSELVQEYRPVGTAALEAFLEKLDEYEKSELYLEAINTDVKELSKLRGKIGVFFCEESDNTGEEPVVTTPQIPRPFPAVRVIPTEGIELGSESIPKSKKKKVDINDPFDVWNCHHFLAYFEELFVRKHGTTYQPEVGDLRALKLAIDKCDNNEQFKQRMEIYFEHSEVFSMNNLKGFCGHYVQNSLTNYLTYGKFNTYKSPMKTDKPSESEAQKVYADDDDSLEAILWRKGL